ncbi:MAG TPA: hypothetical protein DCS88_07445 [Alphaproteobacteria bacterium]|nr:hypothetical protein [Alphaproteobacteria bacterium]
MKKTILMALTITLFASTASAFCPFPNRTGGPNDQYLQQAYQNCLNQEQYQQQQERYQQQQLQV